MSVGGDDSSSDDQTPPPTRSAPIHPATPTPTPTPNPTPTPTPTLTYKAFASLHSLPPQITKSLSRISTSSSSTSSTTTLSSQIITHPTPIQLLTVPSILAGKNSIIASTTGSGKTLSYLIPGVALVHKFKMTSSPPAPSAGPVMIVLLPTRELKEQVEKVRSDFPPQFHIQMYHNLHNLFLRRR